MFPLDEGGNILNVGAFLSQLLRDLCAAGAESVQDVQSRLIINAARSLALSLEGEAHLIQNPGGEKRSLGNLHLVVLLEAVGGALSKIKVSHSTQPRFVLESVGDRHSLRLAEFNIQSAQEVSLSLGESEVLHEAARRRRCVDDFAFVFDVSLARQEEGHFVWNHRTVELHLRDGMLRERTSRGKRIPRVQSGIAKQKREVTPEFVTGPVPGNGFNPPLARPAELSPVRVLVHVDPLQAGGGNFKRAFLNTVHNDLRAAHA